MREERPLVRFGTLLEDDERLGEFTLGLIRHAGHSYHHNVGLRGDQAFEVGRADLPSRGQETRSPS